MEQITLQLQCVMNTVHCQWCVCMGVDVGVGVCVYVSVGVCMCVYVCVLLLSKHVIPLSYCFDGCENR